MKITFWLLQHRFIDDSVGSCLTKSFYLTVLKTTDGNGNDHRILVYKKNWLLLNISKMNCSNYFKYFSRSRSTHRRTRPGWNLSKILTVSMSTQFTQSMSDQKSKLIQTAWSQKLRTLTRLKYSIRQRRCFKRTH